MAEQLDADMLRDLQQVLEISRAMGATLDTDNLLHLIVDRGKELLDAERATLWLYERERGELHTRIAHGVDELRVPADRGITGATVGAGETIHVPDAYADERFNPSVDRETGYRTRNILSVPLRGFQGDLVGVLQVLNKCRRNGGEGCFTDYDISLAETLAAQAGVAIQRANLLEHYVEKQQMAQALQIAREIQQHLLPQGSPHCCGFDIAGFGEPADETGGDAYDFMMLPDGRWMLIVADATGHGVGPAMVVAETRAMLRAVSLQVRDVSVILTSVNELLTADLSESRFVTCFFGVLDPLQCSLTFASAGHGPILLYRRERDEFAQVPGTGLPLGVLEDADYDQIESFDFADGDFVLITTDGFFEAQNAAGEEFGVDRMLEQLRADRDLPAEKMIENLHGAVLVFTEGLPQADDLTAVAIRRKPKA